MKKCPCVPTTSQTGGKCAPIFIFSYHECVSSDSSLGNSLSFPKIVKSSFLFLNDDETLKHFFLLKVTSSLTFEKPDLEKFRCIKLAYEALKLGDSYPLVLNVVNDICVNAFLNNEIKFIDIPNFIDDALQSHNACKIDDIDSIFNIINSTKNIILRKLDSN